ncbi:glycosyltransferase [Pseudoruegeria sp. SHC-113]|uniref:glycosyltransferase n=1 Tax=Pseudoruegeria sp. SHC-113 TaxID=2855439 RepID=UPI0021BB7703|nr:glycosyltransferase [Pseudoruegeria sp. SHC-113]MCT8159970.1 glycosyltransferase [Pseudoruegeria sp. SHC-113]
MKLLFLIPNLSTGGAERVVVKLAELLSEAHDCAILIARGGAREYKVGVPVHESSFEPAALRRSIEALGPDVILDHYHWDAEHVADMAQMADDGWKVVMTEHNSFFYPLFQHHRERKPGYDAHFEKRYESYAKFAAVTVLNQDAADMFSRHLTNVHQIRNPISYRPNGTADFGSAKVLNVSHYRKEAKRLDLLYEAFGKLCARNAQARLAVIGPYDATRDATYSARYGIDKRRLQRVGRSLMVAEHYNSSAVFALSSEIEGQPMVLLEAALHCLPQVVFDIPGMSDQVVDGITGYVVPFGDTDAFAARMDELLSNRALAREMGYEARAFVQAEFAPDAVAAEWNALLDSLQPSTADGPPPRAAATPPDADTPRTQEFTAFWERVAAGQEGAPPKISYLVPVYDTEPLLGRCLDSIRTQTMDRFECIVVDDGSPGDTEAAFREVVGNDPRFKLVRHEKNGGLYKARSTAAEEADGMYFSHVDSDDYLHAEFGSTMLDEALARGADIVECNAVEIEVDGRPVRFSALPACEMDGPEASDAFFNRSIRNVVWNKLYRRDLWWRHPEHNAIDCGITITEDMLRNAYAFSAVERYSKVSDCLYYYCRRPTSVVRGGGLQSLLSKLAQIEMSYTESGRGVARITGNDRHISMLEKSRFEDRLWYIEEYLRRTPWHRVQLELDALPAERGQELQFTFWAIAQKLGTERQLDDMRTFAAHRTEAWMWEKNRADQLRKRLSHIASLTTD